MEETRFSDTSLQAPAVWAGASIDFFASMNQGAILLEPLAGAEGGLRDFRIKAANAAALTILGKSSGDVVGHDLQCAFPDVLRYGVFGKYRQVLESGEAAELEAQYNRGDRIFWFRVSAFPFEGGVCAIFNDITDVVEEREALRQTNRALERFTGTIAHDLKAPLRRIVQYVEVLAEENAIGNEEHKGFFSVIQNNARHASSLIDNLLTYSKAQGPVHDARQFNISLAVNRALEVLASDIADSGARVEVADSMPNVMGNQVLISQVFQNLIANAIRHNDKAEPHIRITGSRGQRYGEFSVMDNGPGIPAHETRKAFDFMVSLSRTGVSGGAGLGLAIAKEIVERHYGSIWIDPFYKEGACFSFLLPLGGKP